MKLRTPRWWYVREGAPAPLTRALLRPPSWLWAWATARKHRPHDAADPGVPVICVGNLTMGGVGKTPIVRGPGPAAGVGAHGLSRGYGGKLAGPVRVDPAVPHRRRRRRRGADAGPRLSDVGGPRPRGRGQSRRRGRGPVVVMDDGHQNPSVKKTLSLVVVDGETRGDEWPFGDGASSPPARCASR
jgi:tetraacyldisaccharide 4'-kinase